MDTVTISPMSLEKAVCIGQIANLDTKLREDALEAIELQERLFEVDRRIVINALERMRLRVIVGDYE